MVGVAAATATATATTALTGVLSSGISAAGRLFTGPDRPPVAGGPPLAATVDVDDGSCAGYLSARAPQAMPIPDEDDHGEIRGWASTAGAVHADHEFVTVTIQGSSDAAVVLLGLSIHAERSVRSPRSSLYYPRYQCGGDTPLRTFTVDLDRTPPAVRADPGESAEPAIDFPYQVSSTDPEVFLISASTAGCDCRWTAELQWASQGRTGALTLDDVGQPFRTAAGRGLPAYTFDGSRWAPLPPS